MNRSNIFNPLNDGLNHLIVDSQSALPLFDAQTPQERFRDEKEHIEMTEKGYATALKVARAQSHILGLQRRLARLAYYRADKECLPSSKPNTD